MNKAYSMEEKYRLIKDSLLKSEGSNPIRIAKKIMQPDYVPIHGPEHHFLDGGAFMAALKNAGLAINLEEMLDKLAERSIKMPGAMCGYWGVCGSITSLGATFSLLHEVGPLSDSRYYSDDMEYASLVIKKMSEIGGPRCCKRNAFISISTAISFAKNKYGIELEAEDIICEYSDRNQQCIGDRCPFSNSRK